MKPTPMRTTARRAAAVPFLLVLALAAVGLASAGPPAPGTSSVSIGVDSSCLVTVAYSWQGFKGKNLVAEFVVVDDITGPFDLGIAYKYVEGVSGSSSGGPVQVTFQFTPGGSSPAGKFGAIGRLGKFDRSGQFKETLPAAQATSTGPFNTGACGYPAT